MEQATICPALGRVLKLPTTAAWGARGLQEMAGSGTGNEIYAAPTELEE